MRRLLAGIRLSKVDTSLLIAGVTLLLVAVLGQWVTIGGNQVLRGAPKWVPVLVGAVGVLGIVWAVVASRERSQELRTGGRFLGVPPKMPAPDRLVKRPVLLEKVVAALRAGGGPVALTGIGGVGNSTPSGGRGTTGGCSGGSGSPGSYRRLGLLGQPDAGGPEHRDDRGIAALREAPARTGMFQPGQLLAGEDRDQLVGDARRLQPFHRVGQLVFGVSMPAVTPGVLHGRGRT